MRPIVEVAEDLRLDAGSIIPYGRYIAKVPLEAIRLHDQRGKLVVMTGITPTPAGEGKTTVGIALTEAMGRLGKRAAATLREPAMGPVFGTKGGGTGGGKARVVPEDEINLHFTGDAHAVGSAHNLLAALTENAVRHGAIPDFGSEDISWRRVTDVEDRALRQIVTGLGGRPNGPIRETGFDIVTASEIMAILALAEDFDDLRVRLDRMTVGHTNDGAPVTAGDVGATGSLMALLRHALLPNLVQTLEGQPVLIHTGPFGNIAHGCSSVIADRLALSYADYVVTEAGFGADLGLEKFMHIKVRSSGLRPAAAVVVATVRALKLHGGVPLSDLDRPDPLAVRAGAKNLEHMVGIVRAFGLPAVVAINRFPKDAPEEIIVIQDRAISADASAAVVCTGHDDGGKGAEELAEAVFRVADADAPELMFLYRMEATLKQKLLTLAHRVYAAGDIRLSPLAERQISAMERAGQGSLPICMAKTPLSLSHDPSLKGVPDNYTFEIAEVRVATGAGFVYPIAGTINTLPGLPEHPRSLDVDPHGNIIGL